MSKVVQVKEIDLIMMLETLETAKSLSAVLDLTEALRKLNRQNRSSPLTLALDQCYDRVSEYLNGEDDDGVSDG